MLEVPGPPPQPASNAPVLAANTPDNNPPRLILFRITSASGVTPASRQMPARDLFRCFAKESFPIGRLLRRYGRRERRYFERRTPTPYPEIENGRRSGWRASGRQAGVAPSSQTPYAIGSIFWWPPPRGMAIAPPRRWQRGLSRCPGDNRVKFPWINMRGGLPAKPRPAIRCVFRNGSTRLPSGVLAILDTGADSTVLPKRFASLLGYSDVHLDEIRIMSIGATITAWKVRDVTGAAVKIGGVWVDLSCLMFVEGTPALLGRDVVLANFDLLMRQGQTELRPRKK